MRASSSIVADGITAYSLMELDTYTKMNLKVSIVGNNGSWEQMARDQVTLPGASTATVLPKSNYERVVEAFSAAGLLPDGATVFSCGIAGNARCSAFFWSIREHFQKTGHPRGLTWVNVAAQGGRGKVPGTIEEIAFPGLITQYISGHLETAKALLKLGDSGKVELHTMPQGVMTQWLEARSNGAKRHRSSVGVGSFMDSRVGNGGNVTQTDQPLG